VALTRSAPLAVALLIGANLIPLAGVLWFGWDVATILYAYWIESGIVGLLNVPKMLLAGGRGQPGSTVGAADSIGGRMALVGFFAVHYGLFWLVHGVFITVLTGNFMAFGFGNPLATVTSDQGLLIAAAALFASHAVSLWLNFLKRGEYRTTSIGAQMFAPYPRVFVMHITIVLGGIVVIGAQQPVFLVALLVLLKTVVDLGLHLREHGRRALAAAPPP
jgi:hypothetical protein